VKASLHIGNFELALSAPMGPLETLLCHRYAAFLGAVDTPACWISLEPLVEPLEPKPTIQDGANLTFADAGFRGSVALGGGGKLEVVPDAAATDALLLTIVATFGPAKGVLVMRGDTVVTRGRAHLFVGAEEDGHVSFGSDATVLERRADGVIAHSAPVGGDSAPLHRAADLHAIWADVERDGQPALRPADAAGLLLQETVLPVWGGAQVGDVLDVATDIASTVPMLRGLPEGSSWDDLDRVGAEVEVDRALGVEHPRLRRDQLLRVLGAER
jgi:hypothetical protein